MAEVTGDVLERAHQPVVLTTVLNPFPRLPSANAQEAFNALSAIMHEDGTDSPILDTVREAAKRRADARRINLERRETLATLYSEFKRLTATARRQAFKIPQDGDILLNLEDAMKGEAVERKKDEYFGGLYKIMEDLKGVQEKIAGYMREAAQTTDVEALLKNVEPVLPGDWECVSQPGRAV
ncbi:hypothetical protein LTR10_017391 [Elasticomyces elasticus]|uniref:Uncharacterized protein n=1 Tax=Exophiala sideris TaxID=1016849 RepID=A0ABR0J905_9EURO|nr:hypothetical protein LTR10_017391 [Elasticomyces elasticus]KAK5027853.1 hypothetical protein LTS07_006728 [Exophiala sideris]KAK5037558.1 hypothetical protein LTR13_004716 [Exophiala sideris]KAK5059219.1 hypothetical protein LTR69_006509 [Exophiala sideris]KAK5183053.1 hypothetical protein LTR44_004764 [Eurotiomycetes sp. CCFEE 6388]